MNINQKFNPNDKKYKVFCCNIKLFILTSGLIEVLIICFLLFFGNLYIFFFYLIIYK